MTGKWTKQAAMVRYWLTWCVFAGGFVGYSAPAQAVVRIFDGFGDADVDNNNVALELNDANISLGTTPTIAPYVALGNGGTPPVYPTDTMVNEVTAVEDPNDRGIRWFSISPFSGANNDPRVSVHVINDAAGALPETSIGYFHSVPGANRVAAAIDDGLTLAAESKGRANQAAGFFNNRIELGPQEDDAIKVSFDFRLWFSAPNLNTELNINHIPAIGELRFGIYKDADDQLGDENSIAGPGGTPAIWGQAHGNFRGDNGTVGANNDIGWFARIPIDDPENPAFPKPADGAGARIVEEVNTGSGTEVRIMNGTTDPVAQPDSGNPQFVNLDIDKVYNLSLTLTRFDDPLAAGDADSIMATVTVVDRATSQQWTFGNYERVIHPTLMVPDGISSDEWDYFVMGLAGAMDSDDFDWIIDNFKVELFGSNATLPGDHNQDGKVDAADYVVWRNGPADQQGYLDWRANFGLPAASGSSSAGVNVPEPASLALLVIGGWLAAGNRKRDRRGSRAKRA